MCRKGGHSRQGEQDETGQRVSERRQPCMCWGHEQDSAAARTRARPRGRQKRSIAREDRPHRGCTAAGRVHHHRDGVHTSRLASVAHGGRGQRGAASGRFAVRAHDGELHRHAFDGRESRHGAAERRADVPGDLEGAARREADDQPADVLLPAGEDRRHALRDSSRAGAQRRVGAVAHRCLRLAEHHERRISTRCALRACTPRSFGRCTGTRCRSCRIARTFARW